MTEKISVPFVITTDKGVALKGAAAADDALALRSQVLEFVYKSPWIALGPFVIRTDTIRCIYIGE